MTKKYPFYIKSTLILFGLVLFVYILATLREIVIPIAFALMISILLNPLAIRLNKWKIPRVLSITISIILAILFVAGVSYLLYSEISSFSDQVPVFEKKGAEILAKAQAFATQHLGVDAKKQAQYISQAEAGLKPILATAMGSILGTLSMIILLPVYTFLFLYYKPLIVGFLYDVFAEENAKELSVVLTQTKGAIQSYMVGLLLEAIIVGTLNSVALLILGIKYAILLGVLGAILNILPFIGGILAVLLPLLIALVTKDGLHAEIEIVIAYMVIQFIDNHFLVPYIVSSKVKINALISLIIVFLGGALWGVAGMFLSIPFIGVLKIIFDRIPEMKPWGKLLGVEIPTGPRRASVSNSKRKIVNTIRRKQHH